MNLGEGPPHGFDVFRRACHVCVLVIQPVADTPRQTLPVLLVCKQVLSAYLVETRNSDSLDLRFSRNSELLLCLDLHGKTVSIPAGDSSHVPARHCAIPSDRVLDRARDDVMDARSAVRRRRPFVEHELGRTPPELEALVECVLVLPGPLNLVFQRNDAGRKRSVGHGRWNSAFRFLTYGTPQHVRGRSGWARLRSPLARWCRCQQARGRLADTRW